MGTSKRDEYLGKEYATSDGYRLKIVEYKNSRQVTVEFEDGRRKPCMLENVLSGSVKMKRKAQKINIGKYIGKTYKTNEGYKIAIVEYKNCYNITVEFENGYRRLCDISSINKGSIKNPYHKSVCGVGYIGDGEHVIYTDGVMNGAYVIWNNMLRRCYIDYRECYQGCLVDEEWHNFQTFCTWYKNNMYTSQIGKGMNLDKDILIKGNRVYSKDNCLILPDALNKLFIGSVKNERKLPIGVTQVNNKYRAELNLDDSYVSLGHKKTPEEAFQLYKEAKEDYIKRKAQEFWESLDEETKQKDMPQKVYKALMEYTINIDD